MPGVYSPGEYDLAGFCVGAVERGALLPRLTDIATDDVLIGVSSSGVHSNGFSLVRKVLERANLSYSSPAPFGKLGQSVGKCRTAMAFKGPVSNICIFYDADIKYSSWMLDCSTLSRPFLFLSLPVNYSRSSHTN